MSTSDKIDNLKKEILSIERRLKSIPDFLLLEKYNLETRKASLEKEIIEIGESPVEGQMASSVIHFYGEPVIGSSGIRADFCGRALERYQHFVSNLLSKVFYKHFKGRTTPKPSKASRDNNLVIVDVTRGSFGFVFQESGVKPGPVDSLLSKTLEEANSFISIANSGSDQELQKVISDLGPRSLSALREFIDIVVKGKAYFKISTKNSEISMNSNEIISAHTRLCEISVVQNLSTIPGFCAGLFLNSMGFEFIPTGQKRIKGKIAHNVDKKKLSKYLYGPCMATFQVKEKSNTKTGKRTFEYLLLDLDDD